jgi:subtilase family serine protease
MVVIHGTAPKIVQKAISLGPAPPHKEITVMILPKLKMNELDKYIQELYTPGSPNYGKFLTPQQVYAKFGYGIWQPQVIANYAQMYGIEVEQSGPFIKLKGTTAQFQQFFRTNFKLYKYGGRVFYAPEADVKLPATIAPYVGAILGLHNITVATPYVKHLSKAIKNATYFMTEPDVLPIKSHQRSWLLAPLYTYTPLHLHELYSLNPLYRLGLNGSGQTIVIINAYGDPYVGQALAAFDKDMGLPDPLSSMSYTTKQPSSHHKETRHGGLRQTSTSSGHTPWPPAPTSYWSTRRTQTTPYTWQ